MYVQTEIRFDHINSDLSGSLLKQRYIVVDGVRNDIGQPERMAVTPGDIEQAKIFIDGEPQPQTGISAASGTMQRMKMESLSANTSDTEHPIIKVLRTVWTDDVVAAHKAKTEAAQAMMPGNL